MKRTMKIEGMMCPHCEAKAKKALEAVPGVSHAELSHVSGTALVTGEGLSDGALKAAVQGAGYTVTEISEGE